MAKDSELQKCKVNIPVFNRRGFTQFTVVPPDDIQKIGSIESGSDVLTVNDTTGLVAGLYVYADGIRTGTQIDSILGQQVTLTKTATESFTYQNIIFYQNLEDGLLPLTEGQTVKFL